MTDTADPRRRRSPHGAHARGPRADATSTGLSNEKLGMWVFLGSECLLFGGLISTYLLYKEQCRPAGPDAARALRHPVHVGRARSCC